MPDPVIQITDVSFSYGGPPVLDKVSMRVEQGDFLAVLGPNGGGKSTLLKLILGLLKPDSGRIKVLGKAPGHAGDRIGYLPQYTHVSEAFPITVLDAAMLGLVRPGLSGITGMHRSARDVERTRQVLEQVDLLDQQDRLLKDLSGGQRQRVFIARALVSAPELLLLDEPTASVDTAGRGSLLRLLTELNKTMTVIMVSHDVSAIASSVKSVACVNRDLHFHPAPIITDDMFQLTYGKDDLSCPMELVTHGTVPHRVLKIHPEDE